MLTLDTIEQVCDTLGSVTEIWVTDPKNVGPDYSPIDPFIYYKIEFRKFSGSYKEVSRRGDGGDYADQELQFFLPMRRAAVQTLIRRCGNRRVSVFAYSKQDSQFQMINCRMGYEYVTGSSLADSEGYNITFSGITLNKGYNVVNGSVNPTSENLTVPGDPIELGAVPIGNDDVFLAADCCVTVQLSPLLYIPPETGNDTLLSMFVIGSDGNKYFIDSQGVRFQVDSDVKRHRVTGDSDPGYVFTLPWTVINPSTDLLTIRGGVVSKYNPPPADVNQHESDGTTVNIHPEWPLTSGEYMDFIKLR